MFSKSSTWCDYQQGCNLFSFGLRACLQGGGQPEIGEVTCGGQLHLSCKRDQIKMTDYMNRRVTPPKRVTSSTWGPSPPCKPALSHDGNNQSHKSNLDLCRNKRCWSIQVLFGGSRLVSGLCLSVRSNFTVYFCVFRNFCKFVRLTVSQGSLIHCCVQWRHPSLPRAREFQTPIIISCELLWWPGWIESWFDETRKR